MIRDDERLTVPDVTLHWLDCPKCGASAGEPCRTPGGRRTLHHSDRRFAIGAPPVDAAERAVLDESQRGR